MNRDQIIKQLRDMAKHPTVTLPRDCEALKAAADLLAQPEQEPVGFTIQAEIDYAKNNPKEYAGFWANKDDDDEDWIALYTKPPQRKQLTVEKLREHWQVAKVLDMTDAEIDFADYVLIARDVEALYGIKGEQC